MVDRAVDFANAGRIETRFGELTIDIAGKDEGAMRQARCPAAQDVETLMRHGASVERQAMSIEAPAEARIAPECVGAGGFLEVDTRLGQRRVGPPEAFAPAKVGQPGIDAHASASGNQQAIGIGNQSRGAFDSSDLAHARSSTRSREAVSSLPQPCAISALSCCATVAVNGTGTPDLRAASSTSPKSL